MRHLDATAFIEGANSLTLMQPIMCRLETPVQQEAQFSSP